MANVLVSAPYMRRDWEELKGWFADAGLTTVLPPVDERLEEEALLEIIGDVDGVICGDDRFTPRVIDAARNLKVIVKWGTGIDSIDKAYAATKGIPVHNTPGAFTEPVSDSAVAYMLNFCRKTDVSDRILKAGGWEKPLGFTLGELTVGLIGVGAIGSRVAQKIAPFGSRILGNDIRPLDPATLSGVTLTDLPTLLAESDIVSLHCDLNPTSFRIINANSLALTKPGAYLINTARGPLVEEAALIDALRSCHLSGAGLDVFEHEPLDLTSPLRSMPNASLAAHASNASRFYWRKVHENSFKMLLEGLS